MKTIEERATELWKNIKRVNSDEPQRGRETLGQAMCALVGDIIEIIEEGSYRRVPMVDHSFTLKGSPGVGLCRCGLQKAVHQNRAKSRKAILREIRALVTSYAPEPPESEPVHPLATIDERAQKMVDTHHE